MLMKFADDTKLEGVTGANNDKKIASWEVVDDEL